MYHLWKCIRKIYQHHVCGIKSVLLNQVLNMGWIIGFHILYSFLIFFQLPKTNKQNKRKSNVCFIHCVHYTIAATRRRNQKLKQQKCRLQDVPEIRAAKELTFNASMTKLDTFLDTVLHFEQWTAVLNWTEPFGPMCLLKTRQETEAAPIQSRVIGLKFWLSIRLNIFNRTIN